MIVKKIVEETNREDGFELFCEHNDVESLKPAQAVLVYLYRKYKHIMGGLV